MSQLAILKYKFEQAYQYTRLAWHWHENECLTRTVVQTAKSPVPPLTDTQKREIKSYWDDLGYDLKSTSEHRLYYALSGNTDPKFIPNPIWYYVVLPKMNNLQVSRGWEDKAYLDRILQGIPTPKQVLYNSHGHFYDACGTMISEAAAAEKMNQYDRLVVKPTIFSGEGRGVCLFSAPFSAKDLFARYKSDFSVQLPIVQSAKTALFNPTSVNSMRITSLFYKDEVHITHASLKVGGQGSFTDNGGADRYFIEILQDGTLRSDGLHCEYKRVSATASGVVFEGFQIPNYEKVKRVVKAAHQRFPHFGIIGWDVCLDENDEPMIIEANLSTPGQFKQQMCSGVPVLAHFTDEILLQCSPRRNK